MSVNYHRTVKRDRMTEVITALDANTSPDGFATLEITTSSPDQVLVIITLAKPSFALTADSPDSETATSITMQGAPKSGTAQQTGTAAAARMKDGSGNIIVDGLTVGTGSENIVLNSTSITNGQTVSITSGVITHG